MEGSDVFIVRIFVNKHTCNLEYVNRRHRQASSKVIGECIKPKFSGPNRQYKPNDIRQDMRHEFGVNLSYSKAWRAKESALESLWGTPEESFALLPSYCHVLESTNRGTVSHIETTVNNHFQYFFVALGVCIRGFNSSMRPMIAVDASHLKTKFKGCLYIAACLDGNGQIYPIAFGVGPGENDEAYTWFFRKLKEVIGEPAELVFITDRHKSIAKALGTVYPNVHHGLCTYHLGNNIKSKNFTRKNHVVATFHNASKAYLVHEFNFMMQQIENINPNAAQYIRDIGETARWARCHFPIRRYSQLTSNIAESMNAALLPARSKPIVPMIDHIRDMLQRWFYERRNEAEKITSPVSTWLENELKTRHEASIRLHVSPINMNEFRVHGPGTDAVVNLIAKTCTCRKFDLDQYPCVHALAACRDRNISYYSMCSRYYSTETLKAAYAESIYPVGNREEWEIPDAVKANIVLPPIVSSRPAGRPKKLRIPSSGEDRFPKRKCGRCGVLGHNRKTCKNPMPLAASRSGRTSNNEESVP